MQFFPDLISGPSSSICNCPATFETRSAAAADKTAALSSTAAVMTAVQVPSKTEKRNKTACFFKTVSVCVFPLAKLRHCVRSRPGIIVH